MHAFLADRTYTSAIGTVLRLSS